MKSKSKSKIKKNKTEISEIIEFLKSDIKLQITSDRQFLNLEPDFIMTCIYKTCNFLDLVQNSNLAKKMALKHKEEISEENLSFLMKFLVVKEIYKKFFERECNLLDFMAPKMKKVKNFLKDLMDFHERLNFFKNKFEKIIREIESIKAYNEKKEKELFFLQDEIRKFEKQRVEELPILIEIGDSVKKLENEIFEKSGFLTDKENLSKNEENQFQNKKEYFLKLEKDYKNLEDKKYYLENQIVGNYEDILNKKKKMKNDILEWREKIKSKNNDHTINEKKKLTLNFYKEELKKNLDTLKIEKNQQNILREMEKRLKQEKKELEDNQKTLSENEKNKEQLIFIIENEKNNLNLNIQQRNKDQELYKIEILRLEEENEEKLKINENRKISKQHFERDILEMKEKKREKEAVVRNCKEDLERVYELTNRTFEEYFQKFEKKCN